MEWWTHLWLNEGFASWMEYLATDFCFPEAQMWKQFVYQDMGSAFSLDALKSSHPIEVPVSHPDEIDEIFDNISYSKGSTVIRMLYSYLGEESFKKGLNLYLTKHQYKNAYTEDLWEALSITSNQPVKEMMDTWTKQMGYPVITVTKVKENTLFLEQNRFLAGEIATGEDALPLWHVPISIITDKTQDKPQFELLKIRKLEIGIQEEGSSWLKLNSDQTGFYRVYYQSEELRNNLVKGLKNSEFLSVTDRLGIQNDAVALARAGVMKTVEALELLNAYNNEDDYTVWADLTFNLNSIIKLLRKRDSTKELVNAFGRKLYQNIVSKIGWESKDTDDVLTSRLRSLVISQLGSFDDKNIIEESKKRFYEYLNDNSSLSPDLRSCVYGIVLKQGNEQDYESILTIMRNTDFQEEKERCMRALGLTSNIDLLHRTLEFSLSDEVRSQDSVFVINTVARNVKGSKIAWEFLKNNWQKLYEMYSGGFMLNSLISCVTSQFIDNDMLQDINSFFEEKNFSSRVLQQSKETIHINSSWINRDENSIKEYLQQFQ